MRCPNRTPPCMRNKVVYAGWTFTDGDAANGSLSKSQDLTSASLSADSISVEVRCSDPAITQFTLNTPMTYFYRDRQKGTYYLQSVTRFSPDHYVLSGLSALGLLAAMSHRGGLYTGETVREVVEDICGSVPVLVKTSLADIQLYGWLPAVDPPQNSARDNLSQVLFAVGAYLGTDLNGVLRVEPLWDGVACTITADQIYQDASVSYDPPVSAVTVTEHQYIQSSEEQELFNGTAQEGEIITFDAPYHSLTSAGVQILASGANWAKLSSGVGTVAGKAYLHLTKQITETVVPGVAENVKSESDATLVSLVNSRAVAKRLAAYYRCQETINAPFVANPQKPGYVVSVYHPYEKKMVTACISNMDITMSAVMKSDSLMLVGFLPPQPEDEEVLTERIVLTGTGKWIRPAGATYARYVLISAGQGGYCGNKGEDGAEAPSVSWTNEIFGDRYSGKGLAPVAKGGLGGNPGEGGRILEGELDLSELSEIEYSCGVGGVGAVYNGDGTPGELGTDTVFGSFTTKDSPAPENGFTDPTTGERFGGRGESGLPGGNGAGKAADVEVVNEETARKFSNTTGAYDEDGILYPGGFTEAGEGQPDMIKMDIYRSDDGKSYLWLSSGLGSGGAAGAPGTSGGDATHIIDSSSVSGRSGSGANGATPTLTPKKPSQYGQGGRGGYGGGAGGSAGLAIGTSDDGATFTANAGTPGIGAPGSPGGQGADGCIILFVTRTITRRRGALVTKDGKWLLDNLGRRLIV